MNAPLASNAPLRTADIRASDSDQSTSSISGVSWGAILAGAAGAAALSLILLILGTGLGLSSVSPWSGQGATAVTFGISTILWLTFTQLAASGMGGYLAGRLRTKWAGVHTDEVYFRDTAHGFLAWAVATLLSAALLTSTIGSIVNSGVQAGATVTGGVVSTGAAATAAAASSNAGGSTAGNASSAGVDTGYFIDSLFRKEANAPTTEATGPDRSSGTSTAEVARIFANGLRGGTLSPDDTRYAGQVVAQRTGLTQADAEKRVADTFTRLQTRLKEAEVATREAANKARKASAGVALWLFVSLLVGAFVASLAATYGGRRRDF